MWVFGLQTDSESKAMAEMTNESLIFLRDIMELHGTSPSLADIYYEKEPRVIEDYSGIREKYTPPASPTAPVSTIDESKFTPLTPKEFYTMFDDNGVLSLDKLRERVFLHGVHPAIRLEVWRHLLRVYSPGQSIEERSSLLGRKEEEYEVYCQQWRSLTLAQTSHFEAFREAQQTIEKDRVRTDRELPEFEDSGGPGLLALQRTLLSYFMFNIDLGYCQGMNDLMAVMLIVSRLDESSAFWCFKALMDTIEPLFRKGNPGLIQQLAEVNNLVMQCDPELGRWIAESHADNYLFCFRWLFLMFKREFSAAQVPLLFDCLFSAPCANFPVYLIAAAVLRHRGNVLAQRLGFDELVGYFQSVSLGTVRSFISQGHKLYLDQQKKKSPKK